MKRAAAYVSLALGALVALGAEPFKANAQPSAEPGIVLAQNDGNRVPSIFRFLFKNRRQEFAPQQPAPMQIFPRVEREPARSRKQRRSRSPAPEPREVAAVEKAADAKRALVVGDFMGGALAKGLAEAYRENPNVVVVDANSGSSGLVRDDYFDWPAKLPEIAEEQKPDAILVLIGGNDRQTINTESGSHALGSDAWRAAYAARVAALADALMATGKPVLWVGLAPVRSGTMSRDYSAFNGIVREQLEVKGIRYVETWNGFADEAGKFVAAGPDVRGQSVQLRASDGINFTRAGQRKLAYFVENELNELFGGASPLLAGIDPAAASTGAGEEAPKIGPMVPIEALSAAGGDVLSGGAGASAESGDMATAISERLLGDAEASPPQGRADNYLWPPPEPQAQPVASPAAQGAVPTAATEAGN